MQRILYNKKRKNEERCRSKIKHSEAFSNVPECEYFQPFTERVQRDINSIFPTLSKVIPNIIH